MDAGWSYCCPAGCERQEIFVQGFQSGWLPILPKPFHSTPHSVKARNVLHHRPGGWLILLLCPTDWLKTTTNPDSTFCLLTLAIIIGYFVRTKPKVFWQIVLLQSENLTGFRIRMSILPMWGSNRMLTFQRSNLKVFSWSLQILGLIFLGLHQIKSISFR